MLRFEVLQNVWIWTALGAGLILVLVMSLTYAIFQRPPSSEERGRVPWVLVVTYAVMGAVALALTLAMAFNPPNW